jgi:PadR family transcriptional regulator PadR
MAIRDLTGLPHAAGDFEPTLPAIRAVPEPETPDGGAARPIRPRDEFVTGWLALLLERGATYGYELRGELEAHAVSIDQAVVYRTLRRLEADGWVTSRWVQSEVGPRRRSYTLTRHGRRQLDEVAGMIAAVRDQHDAFLDEHRLALQRRRGRSA